MFECVVYTIYILSIWIQCAFCRIWKSIFFCFPLFVFFFGCSVRLFFSFVLSLLLFSTNQNKWISFAIKLNQLPWIRAACNFISVVWPWKLKLNAHANAILSISLLRSILYDTSDDDDGGGEKNCDKHFYGLFILCLSFRGYVE